MQRGLNIPALAVLATLAFAGQAHAATKLTVSAPSDVVAGEKFKATVTAKTGSGKTDKGFRGTVKLTSPDEDADLPGAYKFKESDKGKHVFKNLRLRTAGDQSLKAKSGGAEDTESISVAELTCAGENYDVNGDVDDGCEAEQPFTGNTTKSSARFLGNTNDCTDEDQTPGSISGTLLSDTRTHDPAPDGFDATAGSASGWFRTHVSDEIGCTEFYTVNIKINGGSSTPCYRFEVTWVVDDGGETGTETISNLTGNSINGTVSDTWGPGGDDTANFFFEVEKTCPSSVVTEEVTYTITYTF